MKIQVGKCKENLVLVLPKEAVAQLGWGPGDIIDVQVVGDDLKAARAMTAHDHAMEIATEVMEKYHETFEALAKT